MPPRQSRKSRKSRKSRRNVNKRKTTKRSAASKKAATVRGGCWLEDLFWSGKKSQRPNTPINQMRHNRMTKQIMLSRRRGRNSTANNVNARKPGGFNISV